jgi:glycosyltransferase involved in cell wall biosynthesis
MSSNLKILHITPHLGGGVGSVIREYLEFESKSSKNVHKIASLDYLNAESKELFGIIDIEWIENAYYNLELLSNSVSNADIILIHWWNHPLLQDLLMNQILPESRIIVWTHISGNLSPNNFCDFILNFPDKLIFTTPLSFASSVVMRNTKFLIKELSYIWSTTGVEKLQKYEKITHVKTQVPVKIGYVGNLDYSKLHPEFFEICKKISSPGVTIQVIGPLTTKFTLDLERYQLNQELVATGYIPEKQKFNLMSNFDILMYPLAKDHYGTCDQVIQESMALGVVPVVLNNQMENYMIENGVTGLVARDISDFVLKTKELISNVDLRRKLGENAKIFAKKKYKISEMAELWDAEFDIMARQPKRSHATLSGAIGRKLEPSEIFINSLGYESGLFELHKNATTLSERRVWSTQISSLYSSPKWTSPTKSSPAHFAHFFPDDYWLKTWLDLISIKSSIC